MASTEWLVAHRELQYLRAASALVPKNRASRGQLRRRQRYLNRRWNLLLEARAISDRKDPRR